MNNKYEVVIGIENHVELKTKTKMFGPSEVSFNKPPNTCVDEVAMGLPGTLPTVNKRAVELAILACNALNMKINSTLIFDRKHYYYPDLAKGYQITQQEFPIGKNGYLEININNNTKKIKIERLHLEEDTAKLIHKDNLTLIDYNRSGVPLIEIVTEPVLTSSDEVLTYLEKLRSILLHLGVSDAKMNEGSLRCDINISIRKKGLKNLGVKVEIKNLNSFNNVKKAIEFEIKEQINTLENNGIVESSTKRFDEKLQKNVVMRIKRNSIDYRYIRETNLFPIKLDPKWINDIIKNSSKIVDKIKEKLINNDFNEKEINFLIKNYEICNIVEQIIEKEPQNLKKAFNLINKDIKAFLNKENITIDKTNFNVNNILEIVNLQNNEIISSQQAKQIIDVLTRENLSINEILKKYNLKLINNKKELEKIIIPIINKNKELILSEYKNRPKRVEKTIIGEFMKITMGNASPKITTEILKEQIKKIA